MTAVPLTVATLREALANLPDDLPVILSSDEEGNSFHDLWDVDVSKCTIDDDGTNPVHPDDVGDYDHEDLTDVVVLWP